MVPDTYKQEITDFMTGVTKKVSRTVQSNLDHPLSVAFQKAATELFGFLRGVLSKSGDGVPSSNLQIKVARMVSDHLDPAFQHPAIVKAVSHQLMEAMRQDSHYRELHLKSTH
jgi:hypothetical protein